MENTANQAQSIIKQHVILAMEAGLIPVPLADMVAVGGIQMDLIRRLCDVYQVEYSMNKSKAIIISLTATGIARMGARAAAKAIPVIGSIVGGVVMSAFSGASTYAIGMVFKAHFEKGGNLSDIDLNEIKRFYEDKMKKGQEFVESFRRDKTPEPSSSSTVKVTTTNTNEPKDVVTQLRELNDLKVQGIINETEFETLKKKIIEA